MLVPINDYLKNDYGKSLSEIYSRAYFDSVTVDGNIYGLSSKDITGYGISAVFNKSICEKYGIDPDDFNGDWNWLAQQCEKVSDEDIDLIDFQIDCNGMKQLAGFEYDPEFFSVGMGVKEGSSDNKAVNIYSESTQFLQNMKALHDSGYIVSEPTGNDYFVKFVNTDCNALGIMQGDNYTNDGSEEYEITMCEPYAYKILNAVSGVSSKSNNPEEAFDVLALINSDPEIADLIEYGPQRYEKRRRKTADRKANQPCQLAGQPKQTPRRLFGRYETACPHRTGYARRTESHYPRRAYRRP